MDDIDRRADQRVIERRDGPRFALEALLHARMSGKLGRKRFEGDHAVEPRIRRLVPVRAFADGSEDFVRAEPRARIEGHLGCYFFNAVVQLRTAVIGSVEIPAEIVPALRSAATVESTLATAAAVAAPAAGILATLWIFWNWGMRNCWPSADTAYA